MPQSRLGAVQRTAHRGATGALQEKPSRAVHVATTLGELGGELTPRAGHPRVGELQDVDGAAAESSPLGREQLVQDGLARQRVAKAELLAIDDNQLLVDRQLATVHDSLSIDLGDAGNELPIEAAAEDGGGGQNRRPPGRACPTAA